MTPADVAPLAAEGVTRLVISASSAEPAEQRAELEGFARRHALG
jgi:hypothetical protein